MAHIDGFNKSEDYTRIETAIRFVETHHCSQPTLEEMAKSAHMSKFHFNRLFSPVGYLIPCHRVISKSGRIHQYHWGTERKKAIIGYEAARGN